MYRSYVKRNVPYPIEQDGNAHFPDRKVSSVSCDIPQDMRKETPILIERLPYFVWRQLRPGAEAADMCHSWASAEWDWNPTQGKDQTLLNSLKTRSAECQDQHAKYSFLKYLSCVFSRMLHFLCIQLQCQSS